ncbi:MAG: hypothetical protein IJV78_03615 [Clostridia bacterium]|nr:hypothetical protein [bacterium]MBQ8872819.1 hypothetical protein [Clostridia bacterium]MBQ9706959.1 hypothetical protein [Clostridia bacterium]
MGLFKRKPKFIAAVCPQCGGNLEMDAQLQTAYCTKCGAHCLVEDVQIRKPRKETPLQTVVGFIERQSDLNRKDRAARQQQREEERAARRQQQEEERKEKAKSAKVAAIVGGILLVVLMIFAFVMAGLE